MTEEQIHEICIQKLKAIGLDGVQVDTAGGTIKLAWQDPNIEINRYTGGQFGHNSNRSLEGLIVKRLSRGVYQICYVCRPGKFDAS